MLRAGFTKIAMWQTSKKQFWKKAAGDSGEKDECQVRLKGKEQDCWMGTEIGMLGG